MIPIILAVPGFADVLSISPADGNIFPVIACIWILLSVMVSFLFALLSVESVIVRVFSVMLSDVAVISLQFIYVTEPAPVLNFQFSGAVSISVVFVWLAAKSVLFASVMMILLSVVYDAQLVELAALSAEILILLFAAVTITLKWFDSNTTYGYPHMLSTCTVDKYSKIIPSSDE
ncbi:TPA: hypothetical protein DEP21_03910 [Patescibacteria group bacterium]|nr:hypothetical protein [Candidatus Gracilibacteria bacterium]